LLATKTHELNTKECLITTMQLQNSEKKEKTLIAKENAELILLKEHLEGVNKELGNTVEEQKFEIATLLMEADDKDNELLRSTKVINTMERTLTIESDSKDLGSMATFTDLFGDNLESDEDSEDDDGFNSYQKIHSDVVEKLESLLTKQEAKKRGINHDDCITRLEGLCTDTELEEFLKLDKLTKEFSQKLGLQRTRGSTIGGGTLSITVINGRNLRNVKPKKMIGSSKVSSPFCMLKYNGETFGQTNVKRNNLNPNWNSESFNRDMTHPLMTDEIRIEVYDNGRALDRPMDYFSIKFKEIVDFLQISFGKAMPCPLNGGRGLLNLHFDYKPKLSTSHHLLDFYDGAVHQMHKTCHCSNELIQSWKFCPFCGKQRRHLMHKWAFRSLLHSLDILITTEKLTSVYQHLDRDGSGYLEYWELAGFLAVENESADQNNGIWTIDDLRKVFLRALGIPLRIEFSLDAQETAIFSLQQHFFNHRPSYSGSLFNSIGKKTSDLALVWDRDQWRGMEGLVGRFDHNLRERKFVLIGKPDVDVHAIYTPNDVSQKNWSQNRNPVKSIRFCFKLAETATSI